MGFSNQLARSSAVLRRVQQVIDYSEVKRLESAVFHPDGGAKLQQLAAMDPFSAKAKALVKDILSTNPKTAQSVTSLIYPTVQELINKATSKEDYLTE